MEKYESCQQRITRPASQIYTVLSDFSNFTPLIADKVEEWSADEDHCSFKVKGIKMSISIVDKCPGEYIKYSGDKASPMEFTFWIQMKQLAEDDTRIRLVLHARLNMMMKMMIGSKLREGLDEMARQIARTFNAQP